MSNASTFGQSARAIGHIGNRGTICKFQSVSRKPQAEWLFYNTRSRDELLTSLTTRLRIHSRHIKELRLALMLESLNHYLDEEK